LRGARWELIHRSSGKVDLWRATLISWTGLAINGIVPGRLGEVLKIALAARQFGKSLTLTGATVVVERLLDCATLLLFLVLAVMMIAAGGHGIDRAGQAGDTLSGILVNAVVIVVILGTLGAMVSAAGVNPGPGNYLVRLAAGIPGIGAWSSSRLPGLLRNAASGMDVLRDRKILFAALLQSAAMWFFIVLANFTVSYAMPGPGLSLSQAFLLTTLSVGFSALPSAPGSWGLFEAGALVALNISDVALSDADAVALVLVMHAVQYIPVVLIGMIAATAAHVPLRSVPAITARVEQSLASTDTHRSETESGADRTAQGP
ncbi:MAG: lysylphosphatidylglycerol synthase transmembrane domain-containing protein, partial [Gammaproteobacteria bacterium]